MLALNNDPLTEGAREIIDSYTRNGKIAAPVGRASLHKPFRILVASGIADQAENQTLKIFVIKLRPRELDSHPTARLGGD